MHVFGLTGGIASGKSTVSAQLRQMGLPVVDADQLARDVVLPGTPGLAAIVAAFGAEMLDASGALDRKKMGARVFSDADARAKLNGIVHPAIGQRSAEVLAAHAAAGEPLVCYDAALLVEGGRYQMMRPLVVVTAPVEAQIARSMARDGATREEVTARIAAQMPLEQKVAVADFLIANDAGLAELTVRVRETLAQVCRRVAVDPARYRLP
jgi:dephospho-CoA kinase